VYDDAAGNVKVTVKQTQPGKVFRLPIAVDIYNGEKKVRHNVWSTDREETFTFNYTSRPDNVNVDADKILLVEKKDNKTLENFIHQYKYAGNYVDRREAIDFASKHQDNPKALDLLKIALNDRFSGLRSYAMNKVDWKKAEVKTAVEPILAKLATDKHAGVRADAIRSLGTYEKEQYRDIFLRATNDSSYTVAGAALNSLGKIDSKTALDIAKKFSEKPSKGALKSAITAQIVKSGDVSMAEKIISEFEKQPMQSQFNDINNIVTYLSVINDTEKVKRGVDAIVKLRDAVPDAYRDQTDPYLNGMILKGLLISKEESAKKNVSDAGLKAQVEYIRSKLPEEDKKGF
jgi:aminopeptidase N